MRRLLPIVLAAALLLPAAPATAVQSVVDNGTTVTVTEAAYRVTVTKAGFRYELRKTDGTLIAGAHAVSGLRFTGPDTTAMAEAATTTLLDWNSDRARFLVTNTNGVQAEVYLHTRPDYLKFQVLPAAAGSYIVDVRTAAVGKGYGLGDHGRDKALSITDYNMTNNAGSNRFISNFAIYPAQGLAQVLFEPDRKRVVISASENALGVHGVPDIRKLYYFIGTPAQIYARYKQIKEYVGYPDKRPKAEMFGIGWEAYGALNSAYNWNTRQGPVQDNIQRYLDEGYDLTWGVVGSRYWRGNPQPTSQGTTLFGLWDDGSPGSNVPPNYPDPQGLKDFFHSRGLKLLLGARINISSSNPFYATAAANGYLVPGHSDTINVRDNPAALAWYKAGTDLWGVDGFKEDLCCAGGYAYDDDKVNKANEALMAAGRYVIVRNSAWSVPGDISRREDTEYNGYFGSPADISRLGIAYGASAAPNYYPDIVMGTNQVDSGLTADEERYFVRNATVAAVMPSMAFGYGPWNISNADYRAAVKNAADFHTKFAPYIYSAAVDSFNTGYPHTMTPLPVAYPGVATVYDTPNTQWMLGPSMMATGACFTALPVSTACTANIVLPPGKWIDFETGQAFTGPATLTGYSFPIGKLPVFVGGKGTVVFKDAVSGGLRAKVYPIATGGSAYTFTDANATAKSTITNNNTGWNPASLVITDTTTGSAVAAEHETQTGAFRFTLVPGHNYVLTGGS